MIRLTTALIAISSCLALLAEPARSQRPEARAFATVPGGPVGLACAGDGPGGEPDQLFVTSYNPGDLHAIDELGNVTTLSVPGFAGGWRSVEVYLALSLGLGGWPEGVLFAARGDTVYRFAPDLGSAAPFATFPGRPNTHAGITFDRTGRWDFDMLVSFRDGSLYRVDVTGASELVADIGTLHESPRVLPDDPAKWGPHAGCATTASEIDYVVNVICPDGSTAVLAAGIRDAETSDLRPTSGETAFEDTGFVYFASRYPTNEVWGYPASSFPAGSQGDMFVSREFAGGITRIAGPGNVSPFEEEFGQHYEGSNFCFVPGVVESELACTAGATPAATCERSVQLDATVTGGSATEPILYSWTTDCPGRFDGDDVEDPTLTLDADAPCAVACRAELRVIQGGRESTCEADLTFARPAPTVEVTDLPQECPPEVSVEDWLAGFRALDECGTARLERRLERIPGCGETVTVVAEVWAVNDCGLESERAEAFWTVVDTRPPRLLPPPDLEQECPASVSEAEWLGRARAEDDCGPAEVRWRELTRERGCGPTVRVTYELWAVDACELESPRVLRTYSVVDTTAPVVTPGTDVVACLWPPNHEMVPFDRGAFDPEIEDACSDVTWRLAGCASDQPEEARDPEDPDWNGDGRFEPDCRVLDGGGGLEVRAERAGSGSRAQRGRHYGVAVVAVDACGNESEPTVIGTIHVPHDQSPAMKDCLKTTVVGRGAPKR